MHDPERKAAEHRRTPKRKQKCGVGNVGHVVDCGGAPPLFDVNPKKRVVQFKPDPDAKHNQPWEAVKILEWVARRGRRADGKELLNR